VTLARKLEFDMMDGSIYQRLHPHTYLRRFLERGVRTDGRKEDDWRSVGINVGSISTANGSSLVKWGETTIVCGVKAEIAEPDLDRPEDGWIVPNIDLPPLCSPKYKPGPPADDSQIISDRLFDVLSSNVIDTKSLCIEPGKAAWVLYVDATCVNHDGDIFDAALLAMVAALQNTRLPKTTYSLDTQKNICSRSEKLSKPLTILSRPISLTYGTFERSLLADPSAFEEPLLGSTISVVVDEKSVVGSVLQEGLGLGPGAEDGDGDFARSGGESGNDTEMHDGTGGTNGATSSSKMVERCIRGAKERRLDLLRVLKI